MKRKTAACILLSLLLSLCGCLWSIPLTTATPTPTAAHVFSISDQQRADLQNLLTTRQSAVNKSDADLFLSTVLPSDAVLYKEEGSLIRSAKNLSISDFSLKAISASPQGGGFTAVIEQSYSLNGKKHSCSYEAAFESNQGKLFYGGPRFETIGNANVKVFYAKGQQQLAQKLLDMESSLLLKMQAKYGFSSKEPITIKIYGDLEVFLQSVKFDLPEWTGGWHEYKESIKIYNPDNFLFAMTDSDYREMLSHESAHRMVSELSADNAAYWLQEGIAGINESLSDDSAPVITSKELSGQFTPFAKHKTLDLEAFDIGDLANVDLYYATSKAYAAFLLDAFGWDTMKKALVYMQKHPYLPVTGEEKLKEGVQYTDEAIKAVFGYASDAAFQSAFDKWLAQKHK